MHHFPYIHTLIKIYTQIENHSPSSIIHLDDTIILMSYIHSDEMMMYTHNPSDDIHAYDIHSDRASFSIIYYTFR